MVIKAVVKKATTKEEVPPKPKNNMPVQGKGKGVHGRGVHKVFQLRLDFLVSQGDTYEGESYYEVEKKLGDFIQANWPGASFHRTGGYYLIDGPDGLREACRPDDFDHGTMQRIPGTRPPSWSVSPEQLASLDRQYRVLEDEARPNKLAMRPGNLYTGPEMDKLKSESAKLAEKKFKAIAKERPDLIPAKAAPKKVKFVVKAKTSE